MDSGVLLIVMLVLCVLGWIAQKILIKKIFQKTGKNLAIGRIWSFITFAGLGFLIAFLVMKVTDPDSTPGGFMDLIIILVCLAVVAILLVRNIKGAGVGLGIALTITQALGGLLVLILGTVALATGMAASELGAGNTAQKVSVQHQQQVQADAARAAKQRQEDIEAQEAYAQKIYGMSAQEAFRAGLTNGIDPSLFEDK